MIKHNIDHIRRSLRRPHAHRSAPAARPTSHGLGQLSASELRNEVLALLG